MKFVSQVNLIFRSFAAVGVDPAVMGVGPAAAIPAAVKSAGLELGNIELYEINEVKVLRVVITDIVFGQTFLWTF